MFPGPLAHSLAGKALTGGVWSLETVDIRDFAGDKHRSVDDAPFGGGPGMIMRPDVLADALEATHAAIDQGSDRAAHNEDNKAVDSGRYPVIYLSPRGRPLDQSRVKELAAGPGVILICGRYEGVDERVLEACEVEEVSLGDFVLSGGEPAALALIDAVVRLVPGVVGDPAGLLDESFEGGLLEYPQYTRPRVWRGRSVPEELISGHHERIQAWRRREAERLTKKRRPDLWDHYEADKK